MRGVKDEEKALKFIDILIETNQEAKNAYNTIQTSTNYDEHIMKDFFAYALKQYSDYLNLG
ncbi:F0F1 ATP synthase subunit alpha [Chlamydia trachomatis]|nr:F0F1 ATP synthase subunit alpha [Chlamydia trachomatis]CRH54867.1 F0F1 ATP synthase subunit alpha [Chlamydia trachomatis]CRH55717.1 F0F1 ATP synthase subunit alpha [Chlamydia trachomatis]CRH56935.1 F0F1 ATP synthase subunit alpha [Chlamydia trachomatis]